MNMSRLDCRFLAHLDIVGPVWVFFCFFPSSVPMVMVLTDLGGSCELATSPPEGCPPFHSVFPGLAFAIAKVHFSALCRESLPACSQVSQLGRIPCGGAELLDGADHGCGPVPLPLDCPNPFPFPFPFPGSAMVVLMPFP